MNVVSLASTLAQPGEVEIDVVGHGDADPPGTDSPQGVEDDELLTARAGGAQ
jgi:hypothetical protein